MLEHKPNLWIFGDSYCDPDFQNDKSYQGWPQLIKKEYNVTNFSKTGTGPDYSMQQLVKMLKKTKVNDRKNIHVFFVVSDIFRISLDFANPFFEPHSKEALLVNFMLFKFFPKELKNRIELQKDINKTWTTKQQKKIEQIFRHHILYSSYTKTEIIKTVLFLKELSYQFASVYVAPVYQHIPEFFGNIDNTKNFYLAKNKIIDAFDNDFGYGEDPRNNHIPKDSHKKLVEHVSKWTKELQPFEFKDLI